MISNELLTIIIPVYNVEDSLNRCVNSVMNQEYNNLQIILVDDGSTDRSGEICDSFSKKDDRIEVIHKNNGGLSSARNAGLDISKGVYIGFVDSDDYIESNMYYELIKALIENDADIACCLLNYEKSKETPLAQKGVYETEVFNRYESLNALSRGFYSDSFCDKVFKKNLFNLTRFEEGKYYEDSALIYKIVGKTSKTVLIRKRLYNYMYNDKGITKSLDYKHFIDLRDIIIERLAYYRDNCFENYNEEFRRFFKEYMGMVYNSCYLDGCQLLNRELREEIIKFRKNNRNVDLPLIDRISFGLMNINVNLFCFVKKLYLILK